VEESVSLVKQWLASALSITKEDVTSVAGLPSLASSAVELPISL